MQGYTLNQQRFDKNSSELQQALNLIRKTAQSPELNTDEGRGLIEIISRYTQTFLWLQRYDEGLLDDPAGQDGGVLPSTDDAMANLNNLKAQLITDGNKRSGAFLFVDFLHRNNRLLNDQGDMVINNTGLAALTLLVAESDPNQKETLIKLIMNMLSLEV